MESKPMFAEKIFEGQGGEYYTWLNKEFAEAKLGAGRLVLQPRGFALPHYADSSKIGYVIQGNDGLVGMVFPNDNNNKEVVLKLKKGDIIPVPMGVLSWWYNDNDNDDIIIVFIGTTTDAHTPGQFTYFIQSGLLGVLTGFSDDFIAKAYGLDPEQANTLVASQTMAFFLQLPGHHHPFATSTHHNDNKSLVYNIDDDGDKNRNGWTTVSESKFPFTGKVGLSANLIRLAPHSMTSPTYTADSSSHLIYVVEGHARIQIVGIQGKRVLDAQLEPGHLVIVPKFFVVAIMAGSDGLKCFSVITSAEPVLEDLASKNSTVAAFSPEALQISFNVTQDFGKLLMSNMEPNNSYVIPSSD